ncbi:MAG: response regulator [Desulfuromonadaceae bacterium]|nr:response regulator [Desulfuromonadaceae bacterium]
MNEETTDRHSGRILVVDDTTANLQLLTKLLTGHGYAVYPASDGGLALEFVRTTLPDLILLDIRMPGMDGFEVCRRLKEDARTRAVPVIFISILEDERDKVQGFRAGAVDYITKPFQPEEILARIQTHLRLRELTERLEQKVAERTKALESMNMALEEEIRERRRAEESQRRLNRELRAISNCNQVLVRAEDEQSLLGEICRIVCDEAGYRMAFVGYAENDEGKTIRPVSWAGVEDGYLSTANLTWGDTERGRGPSGISIRNGTSSCIQDYASDPQVAIWRENALQRGYRSSISLPLKNEKAEAFATLSIYSSEANTFTPDEIRLLEELAGDITFGIQALRNRRARRESERSVTLLSFALNNVRESAFLIDEQARFHYVNEESCRMLGYSRDELLTLSVTDVDPDFSLERWPAHWAELKSRHSLTFESHHKTRDGRFFPVELSANYLEYDGQGYNLALARDITDRKRAEEELRLLNAELEQRVIQRTAELEAKNTDLQKMNKVFVGRELKMVELKERIRELEEKPA